ncbi:hypothetical protein [Brevibacterium sp. ZH18]|uniref:hypothetical protein n=1 Tax=Brevibacterium sp. ZH18 TaxID=2927784 RepID=UPI001F606BED|nr:hypothetical protein [Brevibacterium sp. ZH18]MCI4010813.1 hypothetical protein [Brevibacterium sp. ZH18]
MRTENHLDLQSQILSAPLAPWYGDSLATDTLTKLVTGNATAAQKITSLQSCLGLSGTSSQLRQWESLARIASIDIAVARMLEPHVDALGILAEAGLEAPAAQSTWGVYAAEVPGKVVTLTEADGSVIINGEKAWCSLASELSHAVVIAHHGEHRRACAVGLDHPKVKADPSSWPSLGLKEIPSGSVAFDHVPAEFVGPDGWYLDRPAFAWGGIRVAACWFGGALGLARNATRRHLARPSPAQIGDMAVGQIDAEIFTARSVLAEAAGAADGEEPYSRAQAWTLALRVRNIVYRASQRIQHLSRELAGPAALTGDAAFAKADADLTVYLSQHHGPRDEASLGAELGKALQQ